MPTRAVIIAVAAAVSTGLAGPAEPKPPDNPAKVEARLSPAEVAPGRPFTLEVSLEPQRGIKINRYPKIRLTVPETTGLTAGGQVEVGNDRPPPPGEPLDKNYFKTIEPLRLKLAVDDGASGGAHALDAKLRYFYCVTASGFCAPKTVALQIPLQVTD